MIKSQKYIFLTIFLLSIIIFSQNVTSVLPDCQFNLPTFYQGKCGDIIQTCANCSAINITVIKYPAANGSTSYLNTKMTKSGTYYNFSFCDTSQLGTYVVSTVGDPEGIVTIGNICFEVTPTSYNLSLQESIFLLILVFVFCFVLIFSMTKFYQSPSIVSKSSYFMLGYFLGLLPISYFSYLIAKSYLLMIPILSNILYYFFYIILILAIPITFVSLGYMLYDMVLNIEVNKMVKRGHAREDTENKFRRKR